MIFGLSRSSRQTFLIVFTMKQLLFGLLGAFLLPGCYSHFESGEGSHLTVCNFYDEPLEIYVDGAYAGDWSIDDESSISVDPGSYRIESKGSGGWIHSQSVSLDYGDSEMIIFD